MVLFLTPSEAAESRAGATRSCALQGTWRLEALFANGKPWPFDSPHLKIVNATHFAVVAQHSDSVPSETDSTSKSRIRFSHNTEGLVSRLMVTKP